MEKFKEWLDVFTKVATIGGLVVAIFAFFYSVKPAFEKKELENSILKLEEKVKSFNLEIKNKKDLIVELEKENESIKNDSHELLNDIRKKENKVQVLGKNVKSLKTNISNLSNQVSKKQNEIKKLSLKINKVQLNLLKSDWRFFLNVYEERFFNFDKEKYNLVFNITKVMDLDLKPIVLTEKEKEIIKGDYTLLLFAQSLQKFKYFKGLGFKEERFNEFKNIILHYVKLNTHIFGYKITLDGELEKVNKEINKLANMRNIDLIDRHKKLTELRRAFYNKLSDRNIGTIMKIRSFLKEISTSIENIK